MATEAESFRALLLSAVHATDGSRFIEIVKEMKDAEVSQREIYDVILAIRDEGSFSEDQEEILNDALARITGWCAPRDYIFPGKPMP